MKQKEDVAIPFVFMSYCGDLFVSLHDNNLKKRFRHMSNIDSLPSDPAILMSFINTKLRDNYKSLDELCDDMHLDRDELVALLAKAAFEYSEQHNRFW